ncbi:MAG: helix-turn-helix domain-containing GNAT family N-acetyltransferase [Alphaproteobacteria bacterium]|nr:helix-turn-helix domain-containing GNAT family N-acetyltransferase [Alphaproteobacteria bacterium]
MQATSSSLVTQIRSASRGLVRELGFMNRTLAGTDLQPSAVHAIIEIGAAGRLSAKHLSEKLLLEKSTVSRLVNSLIEKREVREVRSLEDARSKHLYLTGKGEKTLAAITQYAEQQVAVAIAPLNRQSRQDMLTGLETYSAALKTSRMSDSAAVPDNQIIIKEDYKPCIIGRIVEMHASYYSRLVGFGAAFETKVANELADFITRLQQPKNAIWYAEKDDKIVGSIAIDGDDLGDGRAHLRWFIVDNGIRGAGIGQKLIQKAMVFCDKQDYSETHLWTFKGLDAARRLYENHGFSLAEEHCGDQWGTEVSEQKFVRLHRT